VAEAAKSPLAGKRVVVTRATEQTSDLNERLVAHGVIPISLPLVSFAPPEDYAPLDAALSQLQSFDWIILTSANAVHAVTSRAAQLGIDVATFIGANSAPVMLSASDIDMRSISTSPLPPESADCAARPQIAVVGPATKSEAAEAGFAIDYVAKTHLGTALAEELGERLRNKSVFLPRSDRANPNLPAALGKLGAKVTDIVAYRTIPPDNMNQSRVNGVIDCEADAILFFSPSAVHNFSDLVGRERLSALQEKLLIVAVGPITARALNEIGAHRIIIAADTTAAAVVDALADYFSSSGGSAAATSQPPSSSPAGAVRA
jgi:uroporphyrinogen III methyltransferase/synthase